MAEQRLPGRPNPPPIGSPRSSQRWSTTSTRPPTTPTRSLADGAPRPTTRFRTT